MMNDKIEKIIEELQSKKKDFGDCKSENETKLAREWNKAIEECVYVVKRHI